MHLGGLSPRQKPGLLTWSPCLAVNARRELLELNRNFQLSSHSNCHAEENREKISCHMILGEH